MNKELIKKRFSRCIETYNSEAIAQKRIASEIIEELIKKNIPEFDNVLEIGSGTGLLTHMLLDSFKMNKLTLVDLIPETKELGIHISKKYNNCIVKTISADIETTHFNEKFDLIISSSTLQWLDDFRSFCVRISQNLSQNGYFIFNLYGPDNFQEIKTITNAGLNYKSHHEITKILEPIFEIENSCSKKFEFYFSDSSKILRHIKHTGVNGIQTTNWNKSKHIEFANNYMEKFSDNNGLRLTYQPMFYYCKHKN